MNEWIDELRSMSRSGERAIAVTVSGVRGSAPRNIGAKMLVGKSETFGTIGGGELEYQCTRIACDLLRSDTSKTHLFRRFPLGANCGQCCGGVVDVLFETYDAEAGWFGDLTHYFDTGCPALVLTRFDAEQEFEKQVISGDKIREFSIGREDSKILPAAMQKALGENNAQLLKLTNMQMQLIEPVSTGNFDIAVFGAGHVGAATVAVLATLDCNIRWIDSRRNFLNEVLPSNVQVVRTASPAREVAAMLANTYYLVMTHSHSLDYDICARILSRDDFAYCGLIGSLSKQRRFTRKLRLDDISNVDRLVCPIGVAGIGGKKPAEIALSVSAQIMQTREANELGVSSRPRNKMHLVKGQ
jgi:xanthine dehydrogenase accessory factor